MPLKDLLKRKDKNLEEDNSQLSVPTVEEPDPAPEFTFLRTTTNTQEVIIPPTYPDENRLPLQSPKRHSRLRRLSSASQKSSASEKERPKADRRLSERLHLGSRSRSASSTSVNVPVNLPEIEGGVATNPEEEAEWEKRATLLAKGNSIVRSGSPGANHEDKIEAGRRSRSVSVSNKKDDDDIQEAIRLHEEGDLAQSTAMFGRLADPNGENNALSQVLYGLALRHGWGCTKNEELAVTYLSYAASNSAEIETLALSAGMKKGGAAKGELTLAIFELANCFRNGWGVKKDPLAAKQYYETAANLGDTDAMNEVAWCYLEGFGCKKDKVSDASLVSASSCMYYAPPDLASDRDLEEYQAKKGRRTIVHSPSACLHRMNRPCSPPASYFGHQFSRLTRDNAPRSSKLHSTYALLKSAEAKHWATVGESPYFLSYILPAGPAGRRPVLNTKAARVPIVRFSATITSDIRVTMLHFQYFANAKALLADIHPIRLLQNQLSHPDPPSLNP